MKFARAILLTAILAFSSVAAFAADITGKWSAEVSGPQGSFTLGYDFKQDGAKLTGTVQGPQGDPLAIKDGKVDGDKISFTVTFAGPQGEFKITNEGKIDGDQITLNTKMEGAPEGGFPPVTLKRVK
jgi:hypothetical protein